ncbi:MULTISPECIES: MFS transporter [Pseudarthrobacter]|uniref:MFS transporter n=1 Tax=Pseudarthrobacter TaxID=1742993 RepID=UPI00168B5DC0|nr:MULTISPECIES: MFS transporter [Pseudarthrobacter]MDQ0000375.1 MFS family permease [Pseudarthrobacter sulfonivorans]QOD03023.1 MFS transporter [Pseudarthrobacter sp. BIM B-2242]
MALQQATLPVEVRGRTRSIRLILLCQVLTLAVWFASTAALPSIAVLEPISETQMALMTSVLQVGFVVGALLSAFLNVADRFDPRNLFAASAAVAAVTTAALLVVSPVGTEALILRALTGVALAGIYPVGMRMVASWATNDLGKLVGLLVGALTIGSALPHLFTIGAAWDWKLVYAASSIAALSAACLVKFVKLGPAFKRAQRFDPSTIKAAWLKRPVRLANLGYLGHMWELYAMWAWIGLFFRASLDARGVEQPGLAPAATFLVIAAGALGALIGGRLADRFGRTAVTIYSMAISGACALTVGWLFGGPPLLILIVAMVWGVSIIADSAQFSACVVELSPPESVGTMLTIQICMGFALTLVTIQSMGFVVNHLGWGIGFSMLALGPLFGCLAMWLLRRDPASSLLAGGRK